MVRDNFKKTFITIYNWYRALTADGWAQRVHSSESAGSKVLSHSWHGEPKKVIRNIEAPGLTGKNGDFTG